MRHLLVTMLVLWSGSISAQGFQPIYSHMLPYFNFNGSVISLEIDAVDELEGDSLYTLKGQWLSLNDNFWECTDPNASSWLGSEVRTSPDGSTRFITATGHEVLLLCQAPLGTTWIAWSDPNGEGQLEATVSTIALEEVLGNEEMVKGISFQFFDENGIEAAHPYLGEMFKIGEYSGLIQAPALHHFPSFESSSPLALWVGQLEGIEGGAGMQNITWKEVMDFEPGDKIHLEEGSMLSNNYLLKQEARHYLSRLEQGDSIIYTVEVSRWSYNGPGASINLEYQGTTLDTEVIKAKPTFDAPPYRPVFHTHDTETIGHFYTQGRHYGKAVKIGDENAIYGLFDGCFGQSMHWECHLDQVNIPGMGGPYYNCSDLPFFGQWRLLLYVSKADTTWGEPLHTRSFGRAGAEALSVYPNPAQGSFRLGLSDQHYPLLLEVFDIQGRLLRTEQLQQPAIELTLPGVSSQLLLLKATPLQGAPRTAKLQWMP